MTDILLIDDDHDLFVLLQEYLQEEGFSCSHAPLPEIGLREAVSGAYRAIILDVMLPGMNGFEVLRRLRADNASAMLPVLMLTARGEEIDRVVGLEMGADDYLGKPFSPRELVARLRALLRRTSYSQADSTMIQVDGLLIKKLASSVIVEGAERELSAPEMRLLLKLVHGIGTVVSREALYKDIFGHPAYPADRSLDMLVSRLRKKLGQRRAGGERIKAVRGEGYIYLLSGEPS